MIIRCTSSSKSTIFSPSRRLALQAKSRGILLGDVKLDGNVNLLDVARFVALFTSGEFQPEGDINQDDMVNLLDIAGFVELLTN